MSLEIILVPLAIAAYGSWKARSMAKGNVLIVETRLKDSAILAATLHSMGGTSVNVDEGVVRAIVGNRNVSFQSDSNGLLTAHVDTKDQEEAISLLLEVDRQYGIQVQAAVVERVKQRAGSLGMNVISQIKGEDGSVNMILEEVKA
jgi:hypothetical protein